MNTCRSPSISLGFDMGGKRDAKRSSLAEGMLSAVAREEAGPSDSSVSADARETPRQVSRGSSAGGGQGAAAACALRPVAEPILAIDPGTDVSGYCVLGSGRVISAGVIPNGELLDLIRRRYWSANPSELAIEMVASYGMAVGREVFETCVWIGRFQQAWHDPDAVRLIFRAAVKLHICGTANAKDANVRQALLDMFPRTGGGARPQIGTRKRPGPLFGVSSHAWQALGVAVVAAHQIYQGE